MNFTTKRSLRHRNPHVHDDEKKQQQPFFTTAHEAKTSTAQPFFQAKLTVGKPGDPFEREADSVANAVVNGGTQAPAVQGKSISQVQRATLATPAEDEKLGTAEARMEKDKMVQEKPEVQRMDATEEEEPVQMAAEEEEEPVQAKAEEEEEPVQMAAEEEEEPVQAKAEEEEEPVQMAAEEEEEPVQAKAEEEEESVQMAAEEEEDPVQAKSESATLARTSPKLGSRIETSSGKGKSLPAKPRAEMENAFGVSFAGVNIHTDADAVEMNRELGAQAFAHGKDLYFNAGKFRPENTEGRRLLAHELTHVVQQGGATAPKSKGGHHPHGISRSQPAVHRQGLLTPAQEAAAVAFNNSRFDLRSRMIIQIITGAAVDGAMGPLTVEAIATFQNTNGLTPDGKVGDATLNTMVLNRVASSDHDHAIQLVTDFFNLDLSRTLSVGFDPALLLANTTFEPGGLRVIRVGNFAFLSAPILAAMIASQLALPAPAVPAVGPLPTHLNAAQEAAAIVFNRGKFTDLRSRLAIQGLVGATPDGVFGQDTVERIADFQATNGLTPDGKVGEQTLRVFVTQLNTANQQNAAIRLIMDFFNLSEHNALLDIAFDPTLTTSNAQTGGDIPGPSLVRIGPPAFAQGFEGLVHTIAHELEHVRQRRVGILNQDLREFLGEAVEIISKGMPEENVAGFFDDARRALRHWNLLPVAEQRANFSRFEQVRNKVRQRHAAASLLEQIVHLPTLVGYNAVVRP